MAESADLTKLTIERTPTVPASTGPRRRTARGVGWLLLSLLVLVLLLLFRAPLLRNLDRLRLTRVSTVLVTKSSALERSSVSGTAANGYVVARTKAALSADTPGRIVEMNVREGQVVRKGEVVARLYDEEIRAALARAEAERDFATAALETSHARVAAAQSDQAHGLKEVLAAEARLASAEADLAWSTTSLARVEALVESGISSAQSLDDARTAQARNQAARASAVASLEAARAAVDQAASRILVAQAAIAEAEAGVEAARASVVQARATLDKTEVRAPFDGVVVLKDAEVGEVVSPNSLGGNSRGSVVTMVDFASLEAQVELPETSLGSVELGSPATIFLDAFPERAYAGSVERIWPTANRQKGTIELRVVFDRPDECLRPEMGVRVVFARAPEPALAGDAEPQTVLLSSSALVTIEGTRGVFVLERDRVSWRALELGPDKNGKHLVRAGLAGGELVVDHPPHDLADGDRVLVEE